MATAAAVIGLVLLPTVGGASAQEAQSVVRLSEVEGWCGSDDIALVGSLQVNLPQGATTTSTYEVIGATQALALGDQAVTATAATDTTIDYEDDIWFGARWHDDAPYTYVQRSVVVIDGVEVYSQLLEALCASPDSELQITLSESFGPVPPGPPGPPGPHDEPVVPRFAG